MEWPTKCAPRRRRHSRDNALRSRPVANLGQDVTHGEVEDDVDIDFDKFDVGNFNLKSNDERELEMQNALNWLRNPDADKDGDQKFQKLDLICATKIHTS